VIIKLHFPEMSKICKEIIIEGLEELIANRDCENITILRHVEKMEVLQDERQGGNKC